MLHLGMQSQKIFHPCYSKVAYMQPYCSWGYKQKYNILISHSLSILAYIIYFIILLGSLYYFIGLYVKIKTEMYGEL